MTNYLWVSIVGIATIIGAFGSLFLKKGAKKLSFKHIYKNKEILFGFFIYCAGTVIYVIALKFEELTIIYPVTAMSYVWTCILAIKFLKEKMNKLKWLGIFLIITGIITIVR
ncbi:MAG: EamA family transporter [archaeon]